MLHKLTRQNIHYISGLVDLDLCNALSLGVVVDESWYHIMDSSLHTIHRTVERNLSPDAFVLTDQFSCDTLHIFLIETEVLAEIADLLDAACHFSK